MSHLEYLNDYDAYVPYHDGAYDDAYDGAYDGAHDDALVGDGCLLYVWSGHDAVPATFCLQWTMSCSVPLSSYIYR